MSELLYKSLPFDCKAEHGDGSEFSGYCAAFNNLDTSGDVIMPGAFAKTLANFLANGQICFNHGEVIGRPLEAREDEKGLFVRGKISDTMKGRDCKTLLKDGVIRKMSIGYRVAAGRPAGIDDIKAYWKAIGYNPTPDDEANLERNGDYCQFLNEIKLYEASPVGFPANVMAAITDVKSPIRLERVKALIERAKSGRILSSATCAYLKSVHDSIRPACDDLKALLDMHDPDAIAGEDEEEDVEGTGSNSGAKKPRSASNGGDTDNSRTTKPKKSALAQARAELLLLSVHPYCTRAS